jgi:hypothetical protein
LEDDLPVDDFNFMVVAGRPVKVLNLPAREKKGIASRHARNPSKILEPKQHWYIKH